MMNIAIDAMGGDHAPEIVVEAVNMAIEEFEDLTISLYGDETRIKPLLKPSNRVSVVHTTEEITMHDEPVKSIRRKKDSSLVVAARDVKDGKADALVSAGNTGALLAASLLIIGRIKGIDRPGIMPIIPTVNPDHPQFILMDSGANADCKAENLHQFAILGNYYANKVLSIENPRVGLINNGTEESKGNILSKEAFELLKQEPSINFVGNIEAKSLLEGSVDVAVTDGFTGNAILKSIEGTASSLLQYIKEILKNSGLKTKIGAGLIKEDLKRGLAMMDVNQAGGAVLLGVKAPVIKAHGSSNAMAMKNAIKQARKIVLSEITQDITEFYEES